MSQPVMAPPPAYTNHAGNVISGVVVALDALTATISNEMETAALPLSIFPTNERSAQLDDEAWIATMRGLDGTSDSGDIRLGIKAYSRSGN